MRDALGERRRGHHGARWRRPQPRPAPTVTAAETAAGAARARVLLRSRALRTRRRETWRCSGSSRAVNASAPAWPELRLLTAWPVRGCGLSWRRAGVAALPQREGRRARRFRGSHSQANVECGARFDCAGARRIDRRRQIEGRRRLARRRVMMRFVHRKTRTNDLLKNIHVRGDCAARAAQYVAGADAS